MKKFAVVAIVPLVLTVLFFAVAVAQYDTAAPVVGEVSISPEEVDTAYGHQGITVTVHVTDDLSGVAWIVVYLRSESSDQGINIGLSQNDRISGDELDGVYRRVAPLPKYSAFGWWTVDRVYVQDELRNKATYFNCLGTLAPYCISPASNVLLSNGMTKFIYMPVVNISY